MSQTNGVNGHAEESKARKVYLFGHNLKRSCEFCGRTGPLIQQTDANYFTDYRCHSPRCTTTSNDQRGLSFGIDALCTALQEAIPYTKCTV